MRDDLQRVFIRPRVEYVWLWRRRLGGLSWQLVVDLAIDATKVFSGTHVFLWAFGRLQDLYQSFLWLVAKILM